MKDGEYIIDDFFLAIRELAEELRKDREQKRRRMIVS